MSWISLLRPGAKDPRHMVTPDAFVGVAPVVVRESRGSPAAMVPDASRLGTDWRLASRRRLG